MNLPSPDGTKRAITDRDVTDGYNVPDSYNDYEDMEFQRENTPGVVEIVELDNENVGDGDNDPDYEPTSARSRGNVVRKRKNGNVKEKKPRSRSRGRRTRSQAAMDNKEVMVDWFECNATVILTGVTNTHLLEPILELTLLYNLIYPKFGSNIVRVSHKYFFPKFHCPFWKFLPVIFFYSMNCYELYCHISVFYIRTPLSIYYGLT